MSGGSTISTVEPAAGNLRVQSSVYGSAIALLYGRLRVSGNLLWYGGFAAIPHTTTQSSGGKGGGGITQSNTTYTYTAAVMMALGEGPVSAVRTVWRGKAKLAGDSASSGLSLVGGALGQPVWGYLSTNYPAQALGYSGMAYMYTPAYDLGGDASIENHSFEVSTAWEAVSTGDANLALVAQDLLTNQRAGASFPAGQAGDFSAWANYCLAQNLVGSPALLQQKPAAEWLRYLLDLSNTDVTWSQGVLKYVPLGDAACAANGATYTPNTTPVYDLTEDHFLVDSADADPLRPERRPPDDVYNHVRIEYSNRGNDYNTEIAERKDAADIDVRGLRTKKTVEAHAICDAAVAELLASLLLQREMGVRNLYKFTLPWTFALLEPLDLVSVTDAYLALTRVPVRINTITETDAGDFEIEAEDCPVGLASSPAYGAPAGSGFSHNYNANPGDSNPPTVFEAPDTLTTNGLEIWIGTSGGPLWGGAQVWVSQDGATYRQVGDIPGPARQGVLAVALAAGDDPDVTNTLTADMSMSRGQLLSGSQADADSLTTLCVLEGELLSYQTANLVAANRYELSYLRRGAYNTAVVSHPVGASFTRVDEAFFKLPFTAAQIGQKFYIKLPASNIYGGAQQSLADVSAITYTPTGAALQSPLPDLTGVGTNYVGGQQQIYWDAVSDFRQPDVNYEIRAGATWDGSTVLGRTPLPTFTPPGNGTYWVAAHYMTSGGVSAYSLNPTQVVVTGATLARNVVAVWDEAATSWSGTRSNLDLVGGELMLGAAGDILGVADFLGLLDVLWFGGVASSGSYTLPAGHTVDIGRVAPCQVSISYTARGQSIYDNFLAMADVLGVSDLFGASLGAKIGIQAQIATAGDDAVYGPWLNYQPGLYNARYFKARLLVASSDPQVTGFITSLNFSVDVPDRIDPYQAVTSASAATPITYSKPFNGGAGAGGLPLVQCTIVGAMAGDDIVISSPTLSGCAIDVYNTGARVMRTVNVQIQGY
ncbi:MAG TPA: hypothetical protein DHV21_14615 [Curvibacter sp.]|nr:hypothetical protein [Curvibacter sp.]